MLLFYEAIIFHCLQESLQGSTIGILRFDEMIHFFRFFRFFRWRRYAKREMSSRHPRRNAERQYAALRRSALWCRPPFAARSCRQQPPPNRTLAGSVVECQRACGCDERKRHAICYAVNTYDTRRDIYIRRIARRAKAKNNAAVMVTPA